jgi:hypothetical protein
MKRGQSLRNGILKTALSRNIMSNMTKVIPKIGAAGLCLSSFRLYTKIVYVILTNTDKYNQHRRQEKFLDAHNLFIIKIL